MVTNGCIVYLSSLCAQDAELLVFWASLRTAARHSAGSQQASRAPLCILLQSRRGSGFRTCPFTESNIIIRKIIQSGVGIGDFCSIYEQASVNSWPLWVFSDAADAQKFVPIRFLSSIPTSLWQVSLELFEFWPLDVSSRVLVNEVDGRWINTVLVGWEVQDDDHDGFRGLCGFLLENHLEFITKNWLRAEVIYEIWDVALTRLWESCSTAGTTKVLKCCILSTTKMI